MSWQVSLLVSYLIGVLASPISLLVKPRPPMSWRLVLAVLAISPLWPVTFPVVFVLGIANSRRLNDRLTAFHVWLFNPRAGQ